MKRCPVCKTSVFEDMDTCYKCMYRFGSNEQLEKSVLDAADAVPSPEVPASLVESSPRARSAPSSAEGRGREDLLAEFLVELEGFLGKFIADRVVDVE